MTETITPVLPQTPGQYAPSLAEARKDGMDMLHQETRLVSRFAPELYASEAIGLAGKLGNASAHVVAEIALPSDNGAEEDHIAVVQIRRDDGENVFALQGLVAKQDERGNSYFWKSDKPLVPIRESSIILGRSADIEQDRTGNPSLLASENLWTDRQYSADVSRKHVSLNLKNDHLLIEDSSSNGTWVKGGFTQKSEAEAITADDGHVAVHTTKGNLKAMREGLLNDAGEFTGRKVITRDTTLGGKNPEATVDIRSWQSGGEAIVVDGSNDPELYGRLRSSFLDRVEQMAGKKSPSEEQVVHAIYEAVSGAMEYDLAYVDDLMQKLPQEAGSHRKVNLSVYLGDAKGVCRHMALAAAWLGGEAAELGLLQGRLTAEVNQRTADNAAHEWARYTAQDGAIFIIDPAQKFVGRIESSVKTGGWEYFRDGEKAAHIRSLGVLTEYAVSTDDPVSKERFKKRFGRR